MAGWLGQVPLLSNPPERDRKEISTLCVRSTLTSLSYWLLSAISQGENPAILEFLSTSQELIKTARFIDAPSTGHSGNVD